MSQTPHICTQCSTRIEPGQRFCPGCGTMVSQEVGSTVASPPPYANPPYSTSSSSPNNTPYVMPSPGLEQTTSPNPPYASDIAQAEYANSPYPAYNATPTPIPPPPVPPPPIATSGDPYNSAPYYPPSAPAKKRSFLLPVIIIVALLVIIGSIATGTYFVNKSIDRNNRQSLININGNGNDSGGNTGPSQKLNFTVTYASDQITFTEVKQASKFADDRNTTYSFNKDKNWVRLVFNEKQTATRSSYFSYTSTFRLILPDGTIVKATNAQQYSGPDQGVQRQNWVDFGTKSPVDLSKLTLRLGDSDEAQMDIPLKDGADISKYQPKQVKLDSQFQYAGMNWIVKSATQSFYYDGKQAKAGQVYLAFELKADNNQDDYVLLSYGKFLRLQAGPSVVLAPEYTSHLDKFGFINEHTTGLEGIAVFLVTPTPDGKYTLVFQADSSRHYDEKTVPVQIS